MPSQHEKASYGAGLHGPGGFSSRETAIYLAPWSLARLRSCPFGDPLGLRRLPSLDAPPEKLILGWAQNPLI